jgi:tetratricopeptide (TPR) repeat protein
VVDAEARADAALALVGADPRRALAEGDAVVAERPRPREPHEVRAVSTAHRAAGLALRDLGDPVAAERRLRRAIAVAERAGEAACAADARMSLSYVLLERGRLRAALSSIDHASAVAVGPASARVRTTRALVLQRCGRTREALAEYAEALPALQRSSDAVWEARLRNNRALLAAYEGDTATAMSDLRRAREIYLETGHPLDAVQSLWNLGWVLGMDGDVPAALSLFDEAEEELREVDAPERWVDRAEVYLRAGLTADATTSAATAVRVLDGRGWGALEAEARMLLAQCHVTASDGAQALAQAQTARGMFTRQDRPAWAALADYLVMRAALLDGARPADLDRAVHVASQLRDVGWDGPAADLRVTAGRAALAAGELVRGRTLLGPLAARGRVARLDVRSRVWFARALLAEAAGERRAADRALRRAWTAVEDQRMLVGATELRAGAARHAVDVVACGARLAVGTGSALAAFDWAELGRAAALRYQPVVPPDDPSLARALTRLRWATRADEDARLHGRRDAAAAAARTEQEGEVLRLTRRLDGEGAGSAPVRIRDVHDRLGAMAYVQYLLVDGSVWAITLTGGRTRTHDLGALAPVTDALARLTFGLRRILRGFGTTSGLAALAESVRTATDTLELHLLAPLRREIGDGPLVVGPTGPLVQVPWSMLATARGRSLHVAPSATVWCRAVDRALEPRRTVLAVAGPGLPDGPAEVAAVAALHPTATVMTGPAARVRDVLDAATRADVLHLAAHGRLRTDNPLFSSLELADGPVTGYDLESLARVPALVLLPACSSGAGHATVADETLGLAWTLMGLGAAAVVAPLLPIPDAATRELMVAVHCALAAGQDPAAALASAQVAVDPDDPVAVGVAGAFVSFGA